MTDNAIAVHSIAHAIACPEPIIFKCSIEKCDNVLHDKCKISHGSSGLLCMHHKPAEYYQPSIQ